MTPVQRFWRNITLKIADLVLFGALLAFLVPFLPFLSTFSRILIGLIIVVLIGKILYIITGILGFWSIKSRVRGVSRGSAGDDRK